MVIYISAEDIVAINKLLLYSYKQKKGDKHKVQNKLALNKIVSDTVHLKANDIYEHAAFLMKAIVKSHVFASGNRRTAFLATMLFIRINGGKFYIEDDPTVSRTFIGIRENYYTDFEIKEWISHGKIKPFKRSFEK